MQQKENKVPSATLGIFPPMKETIRRRYEEDFYRTTQEIAYHIEVRDSLINEDNKQREQEIINKRVRHLEKLQEKMHR